MSIRYEDKHGHKQKSLGRIKKHNPNRESAHSSHTAQWGGFNNEVACFIIFKNLFFQEIFQPCLHYYSVYEYYFIHKLLEIMKFSKKKTCHMRNVTPLIIKVNLRNFMSRQTVEL